MWCAWQVGTSLWSRSEARLTGQGKISGRTPLALIEKYQALFIRPCVLIPKVRSKIAGESNITAANAFSIAWSVAAVDDIDDAADMAAHAPQGGGCEEFDVGLDEAGGAGDGDGGARAFFPRLHSFIPLWLGCSHDVSLTPP